MKLMCLREPGGVYSLNDNYKHLKTFILVTFVRLFIPKLEVPPVLIFKIIPPFEIS